MDIYKLPLFAESWNVAYRKKGNAKYLEDSDSPFSVIENSFRYWAADPFLFEDGEKVYVFAELYDYVKRRGVIGYYVLNNADSKWIPVITEPYHLSFPVIFRSGENIYIMPESSKCSELYLYKAIRFPDTWEKCEVLRHGIKYVDTTPFSSFGKKMAFTYDLKDSCLRILDFTDGQDIRVESESPDLIRPAGLVDTDANIRVAQNCLEDYGKGLVFYQYSLEENMSYKESVLYKVFPEDLHLLKRIYIDGMHTYNCSEHYEIIDIKTRRFNVLNLLFRFISKVKKVAGKTKKAE